MSTRTVKSKNAKARHAVLARMPITDGERYRVQYFTSYEGRMRAKAVRKEANVRVDVVALRAHVNSASVHGFEQDDGLARKPTINVAVLLMRAYDEIALFHGLNLSGVTEAARLSPTPINGNGGIKVDVLDVEPYQDSPSVHVADPLVIKVDHMLTDDESEVWINALSDFVALYRSKGEKFVKLPLSPTAPRPSSTR